MQVTQTRDIQSILIIVNPNSGNIKHRFKLVDYFLGIKRRKNPSLSPTDTIEIIEDFFEKTHIDISIETTKQPGHATKLAKAAVDQNIDAIIVVGGDGTINEVINGISHTDIALGVIPFGTANVFSLEFNLPLEINDACQKIMDGKCKKIDLGKMNGKYFSCMTGIGFDAHVIKCADRYLKRVFGALSYILIGIKEYFTYKFNPIVLKIDDNPTPINGYIVIIGNSKYYGGQMVFAPKADPTDGLLDVCVFKYKNIVPTLLGIIQMKLGIIKHNAFIKYYQAKSIQVDQSGAHKIHIDAEYTCNTPANISVQANALWVIC